MPRAQQGAGGVDVSAHAERSTQAGQGTPRAQRSTQTGRGTPRAERSAQAGQGTPHAERSVQKAQDGAQQPSRWHSAGVTLWQWCTAAAAGISALGLLRVLAPVLGFTVKINTATLALAALLGTPGVVVLLLLRLMLG